MKTYHSHLKTLACLFIMKRRDTPLRTESALTYPRARIVLYAKPREAIKLFLSIELSGTLSWLRLRNLSLSDGELWAIQPSDHGRGMARSSSCLLFLSIAGSPSTVSNGIACKILHAHFPSSTCALFPKAETRTRES